MFSAGIRRMNLSSWRGLSPQGLFALGEPGIGANFPTSHLMHFGSTRQRSCPRAIHSVFESCLGLDGTLGGTGGLPHTCLFRMVSSCRHLLSGCTLKLECQCGRCCPFRNWYTGRARCRRNLGGKRGRTVLVLGVLAVEAHRWAGSTA